MKDRRPAETPARASFVDACAHGYHIVSGCHFAFCGKMKFE